MERQTTRKTKTWSDNTEMDLEDVGLGGTDWIDVVQDRASGRLL
jgi:hypothetical protein